MYARHLFAQAKPTWLVATASHLVIAVEQKQRTTRILIVDDHAAVREGIRAYLQRKTDFTICGEAGDGAEAIRQAKRLKPDVVILDLALPLRHGIEVAAVLKNEFPKLKIVAFSMFADELGNAVRFATRVDALLSKSSSLRELTETIQNLLGVSPPPSNSQPGSQHNYSRGQS